MRSSDGVAHAEEGPVSGRVSLAVLYERSGPAAVRLAYLLTGDKALAEDIAQDAFVRVAGRLAHV
ncbi:MAG: RNA polymerase sigma factor, partial [Actinomycetota bacterium]